MAEIGIQTDLGQAPGGFFLGLPKEAHPRPPRVPAGRASRRGVWSVGHDPECGDRRRGRAAAEAEGASLAAYLPLYIKPKHVQVKCFKFFIGPMHEPEIKHKVWPEMVLCGFRELRVFFFVF